MSAGAKRRSERRQRTKLVALRLLPAEHTQLAEQAVQAGVSLSQLIRERALSGGS